MQLVGLLCEAHRALAGLLQELHWEERAQGSSEHVLALSFFSYRVFIHPLATIEARGTVVSPQAAALLPLAGSSRHRMQSLDRS